MAPISAEPSCTIQTEDAVGRIRNDLGHNPQHPSQSGNTFLELSAEVIKPHLMPDGVCTNEMKEVKNRAMESPGFKVALNAFEGILSEEEKSIFEEKKNDLNAEHPLIVYGTSGTEQNSKELLNTLGALGNLNEESEVKFQGVYFVEDNGHSAVNALAESMAFFGFEIAIIKQDLADLNINASLTGEALMLDSKLRSYLKEKFAPLKDNRVKNALNTLLNSDTIITFADLVVGIQTLSFLFVGYFLNGITSMEIVVTCKFSEVMTDIKTMTIGEYIDGMRNMYKANGTAKNGVALFNFLDTDGNDVQVYDPDLIINENQSTLLPDSREQKVRKFIIEKFGGRSDDFGKAVRNLLESKLSSWNYGGISGKGYYFLLNKIQGATVFMDNYEANGPHRAMVGLAEKNGLNIFLYCPETRLWVAHKDIIPVNNQNSRLGLAVPSIILADNIAGLKENDRKAILKIIQSQKQGLKDGMGVILIGEGSPIIFLIPNPRAILDAKYFSVNKDIVEGLNEILTKVKTIINSKPFSQAIQNLEEYLNTYLQQQHNSDLTNLDGEIKRLKQDIESKNKEILELNKKFSSNPSESERRNLIVPKQNSINELQTLQCTLAVLEYIQLLWDTFRPFDREF